MTDVFISYARKDNQDGFVSNLVTALEEEGLTVWFDHNEIPLGVEYWKEICQGIEGAHTFTALISPNFVRSDICRNEVNHAIEKNKRLMPVLAVDLPKEDNSLLPQKLGQINWTFIRTTDNIAQAVKPFIEAIRTDFDYVRAHTRLLVRAEEWNNQNKNNSFLLRGQDLQNAENWLAQSTTKEPKPTELQTQYVFASRRAANIFQRNLLVGVSTALVVTIVLAVISFLLFRIAERRADEAQSLALAASAQQVLGAGNTDLSLALALEANAITDPPARVQDALSAAAFAPGTRWRLMGHDNWVSAVAYSPDGQQALSGDWDGRLIGWDLTTGKEQFRYDFPRVELSAGVAVAGTTSPSVGTVIHSIAYSPDGKTALVGMMDGVTYLWDVQANREIRHFSSNILSTVNSVAFNADGTLALVGYNNNIIVLWEIASGDPVRALEGHKDTLTSVAFSPDGQMLASGSWDKTVILWDITSGEIVKTLEGHSNKVNKVAYSPDGKWIASVSSDASLILWNAETGEATRMPSGSGSALNDVAFSPDGQTVVAGGLDQTIIFWRIETREIVQRLYGHDGRVSVLAFSADGHHLLSGSEDRTVRLWYTYTPAEQKLLLAHDGPVRGLAISHDGRLLLSSSTDRTFKLWNAETGQLIRTFNGHTDNVSRVVFRADQQTVLSASKDGTVRLWQLDTGKELKQFNAGSGQSIIDLKASPDGQQALFLAYEEAAFKTSLIYWDVLNWKEIRRYHKEEVLYSSIAFQPNGKGALLGSAVAANEGEIGYISLLDLTQDKESQALGESTVWHRQGVYSVAISADGRYALSGSKDNTIGLWDIQSGELIRRLEGHRNVVYAVAFSPDDKTILSGADDRTVILWDRQTGGQIVRYEGHRNSVNKVAFLPEGRLAISAAEDNTLRYWQLPLAVTEMIDWSYANRYVPELTCDERLQYAVQVRCDNASFFPTRTPNQAVLGTMLAAVPSSSTTTTATPSPTLKPTEGSDNPATTPTVYDQQAMMTAADGLTFDIVLPGEIPGISITSVMAWDTSKTSTQTPMGSVPFGASPDHILIMSFNTEKTQVFLYEYPTSYATVREWAEKELKINTAIEQPSIVTFKQIGSIEVAIFHIQSTDNYAFMYNQTMVSLLGPASDPATMEAIFDALLPPKGIVKPASTPATGQP